MKARQFSGREAGLGGALLLLGVAVAIQTSQISAGFSYDTVGPKAVPYVVAAGLTLSGLSILLGAVSGPTAEPGGRTVRPDWLAAAAISAALLAKMVLIETLGWIPVATVAFAIVSWAFGSRRVLLNLLFGLLLAAGTFLLFNYGLGLRLPAGQLF